MLKYGNEYEIGNSVDIDVFLAELPLDLLKENIKEQIENPMYTTINYVNIIVDKCNFLREVYADDEDAIQSIDRLLTEVFSFIITIISAKYELDIDLVNNNFDTKTLVEIGESLYVFFILNYKQNITRFTYNYITKNKKKLSDNYIDKINKKDMTFITLKKKIKNKDDVVILCNLDDILSFILRLENDTEQFFKFSEGCSLYEGNIIKQMVNNNLISEGFVCNYFKDIFGNDGIVSSQIITNIKMLIFKKYLDM